MRVAIVHYHLQSGGVTRIVCHLQKALAQRGVHTTALTGKPPAFQVNGRFRVIPGLQYEADRPAIAPAELAAQMRREATAALGGPPDLWHVHNHSLGKSLVLPVALRQLADEGEHILFQIHDFAEDGRPANYRAMLARMAGGQGSALSRLLYPQADHLHYAVLNGRDYRFLQDAGLHPEQLHLLPNPVDLGQFDDDEPMAANSPRSGSIPPAPFGVKTWASFCSGRPWPDPTPGLPPPRGRKILWSSPATAGGNRWRRNWRCRSILRWWGRTVTALSNCCGWPTCR